MAYDAKALYRASMFSRISNFFTRNDTTTYDYNYSTADSAATVETAAYFDAATNIQRGDTISCVMADTVGGTPVLKKYVFTTAISYGDSHNGLTLQTVTSG